MLSETSVSISPYRDLYFTLGTPLAALKTTEIPMGWEFVKLCQECHTSIADRIQEITLIKDICVSKQSHALLKTISFYLFPKKMSGCLSDFLREVHGQGLNLEVAQKVYLLAQDLKRHVSNRSVLWNALPKVDRIFLHSLSLGSEDLHILKEPIDYQWLGDGDGERAKQEGVTVTDFGDGRLFKVHPPARLPGQCLEFSLVRYPGLSLVKATPEKKQFSNVNLITPLKQLNKPIIGRIGEIFDIHALEEKIQKEKEIATLYLNQLTDLFSCYRSALCSVLDISVCLPLAIGRQGEWVIWNHKKEQWKRQILSPSMVTDLHRLLQVERLWKINVLNDPSSTLISPPFAICNAHLFVDGIYPLPTFLMSDVQERHHQFIHKLDLSLQGQLEELKKTTSQEEEKEAHVVHWLRLLVNRKSLSLQDLISLDSQALLLVRLMHLIDQKVAFQSPLAPSLFYDTASQMLFHLVAPSSGSYTREQRDEKKAERFTDLILNSKKELKHLILLFAVERFAKQASTEEGIQSIMQTAREKCLEVATELTRRFSQNWQDQKSVEEHFMLLFSNDLLAELHAVLHQSCDPQEHLYDKLSLLREAAAYPQSDRQAINQALQSVLHDAMVRKYSHAFLAEMRLVIESINLAQDEN